MSSVAVVGRAWQHSTKPAAVSQGSRAILCVITAAPCVILARQVAQMPERQENGSSRPALSAAASTDASLGAIGKLRRRPSMTTEIVANTACGGSGAARLSLALPASGAGLPKEKRSNRIGALAFN